MGSRGGEAPNPYKSVEASTRFLRVPLLDWPGVKVGRKTEFRRVASGRTARFPYTPTPVVAYTIRGETYDHKLMVLEAVRDDTLWAISEDPEGLAREGFETYDEFRNYWKRRHGSYLPLTMVKVYRVHQWNPRTDPMMRGEELVQRLYGEFL